MADFERIPELTVSNDSRRLPEYTAGSRSRLGRAYVSDKEMKQGVVQADSLDIDTSKIVFEPYIMQL